MELILVAFVAGLVTVLSPCILPMIPLVLATGTGGSKWRPLGVVAGLILSFTVFTLTLTVLVQALGIPGDALRWIAVGVLAVFGLSLLVPAFGARLAPGLGRLARFGARGGSGLAGDLLLGATLGLVWAPCVGPIMASVIVLAATQHVTALTAAITLAYAIGAGIPLLAIAYGGRALALRLRTVLGRAGERVQQAMGVLLLVTCVLLATGQDLRLEAFVGSFLPADWTANLTAIEQQPGIADGLTTLPAATGASSDTTDVQAAAPALPTATTAPPPAAPALPTATTAPPPAAPALNLPDMGLAPELVGTGRWYNSAPTSLVALRGKVVIVDFWTFECYNCNNTLPYIKAWYDKYASQGLVILGVHTPEFAAERDADNVANAIQEKGIKFPVVQDNDYKTWSAYNNNYWPAFYFIDAQGHIRHTHWGEGAYDEGEQVIRQLLAEARTTANAAPNMAAPLNNVTDNNVTVPANRQAAAPPVAPTDTTVPPTAVPPTAVPLTAVAIAPKPAVPAPSLSLPDMGLAPELIGTGRWFNTKPTSLAALRGKVILLNFWTFECYNCNNTLPYVKAWYDKYASQGLVILGVHTPELAFERPADNVANAIQEKGITYPVVQDNDYKTWNAYHNIYWPAFYFIDAQGHIRHTHWGEGAYDEGEQVIRQLLAEAHAAR